MRRGLTALVGLVALALPASAAAGTVTGDGTKITYATASGASSGESVDVGIDGSTAKAFVHNDAGVTSSDCDQTDATRVDCTPAPLFVFNMLGFDDTVDAHLLSASYRVEAHGQGGSDSLYGGAGSDTLDGGPGDDYLYDLLGDDSVSGGANNDAFIAGPGRDSYAGGDGQDTVDYSARVAPVTITVDGVADDGEVGEGDNVATDIESATGGSGNDRIVGGPAASYLFGGGGNDSISARAGEQRIEGNEGDDTIDTRDGAFDSIDCGAGNDTLYADPGDSATGCEIAPDRDGDGTPNEMDCAADNPAVHPGASEIYGNGVDEDCTGGPEFFRVDATLTYLVARRKSPASARWKKLSLANLRAGDKVSVHCKTKGKGCPFASKTKTPSGSTLKLAGLFKKRYLKVGARVDIAVSRPAHHAKLFRLRVVKGGNVKLTLLCVPVGETAAGSCPQTG